MLVATLHYKYLTPVGDGPTTAVISIQVTDSVTNTPANGNNIIVYYDQSLNGAPTQHLSASIPGQSFVIYDGLFNYLNGWTITGTDSGGGVAPPSATCDLRITSITPTTESAPGANDGSVNIIALSSNGPIQYSLDNINWQATGLFIGLAGGSGIAYVIDSLDIPVISGTPFVCSDSLPYFIQTATALLVSDPSVNLGNGNISRWNAAFNPINFTYQRKDFEILSITEAQDGSGNVLLTVNTNTNDVKAGYSVTTNGITTHVQGDLVYIKTPNYSGIYEVLTSAGNTLVLGLQWIADDLVGGFININSLRPYYQIYTQITYVDIISGQFKSILSKNTPDSTGLCIVDLRNLLQSLLQAKDLSDYSLVNYRDMQLSASYTVKYAPVWDGNTPTYITPNYPYYVIYAAMQLQIKGGGNLQDYVPMPLAFQLAKWVTDFINPVYNQNFPFDIGFIFSEYMVNLNPFYKITLLDINQQPLASQTVSDAFLLTEAGSFLLNQDASKFIIASQALVATPIVQHVGLNRLLINFTPPDICWYFKVQLQYTPPSGSTYDLMQPIICRIDQNTTDRPVYMRWIGLTGSWNYYKFVYNQQITLDVADPIVIKNYVFDWANTDAIEDVLNKNSGRKMAVAAKNISVDDINGCLGLKVSPKVQMFISGTKWQTVIVQPGTFAEYDTMETQGDFNLVFALPSLNVQFQ